MPADTSVIRAMVECGHDVRVLADRVLAPDVETTGAEHVPWDRAPQRANLDPQSVIMKDWDTSTPFQAFARARDGAMVGPAGRSPRTCAPSSSVAPPTWWWGNFFVFGAEIAAEAEGLPFAFLVSNLLSFRARGRRRWARVSNPPAGRSAGHATGRSTV